jgi:16S rRNA (adenine1518-N6/adenine1519-N6)-dimethyltransferase
LGCDEQLFRRVVKTVFNQRRKMLRVSLRQMLPQTSTAILQSPFSTLRPEQLTIPQFVELTNMIEKELCATTNDVCADTND